jgi:hypothetical protein
MIASPSPIEFPSAAILAEDFVSILNVASESNSSVTPFRIDNSRFSTAFRTEILETVAKMPVRRYLGGTGIACARK